MSYIRSGSNPEALYIVGGRTGVQIYPGHTHPAWGKIVPYEDWDALCNGFVSYDYDDLDGFEVNGLYIKEDWVDDEDGHNYKIILGYKDEWQIAMWYVTWCYITRKYEPK